MQESIAPDIYITKLTISWHLKMGPVLTTEGELHGWEFQFSVPISGTPIGNGIPIPFLILEIPVGFFFEFHCWKIGKLEFRFQNLEFQIIIYVGTQYTSFYNRKQLPYLFLPKLHHAAILTSTQNKLPPSLHLLKMAAAIFASPQNELPLSLHLLKTVTAISTSTQNE